MSGCYILVPLSGNDCISNEKKLSCILYNIMLNLSIIDNVQFKWLNSIKSIFEKTGLNYLWDQQQPVHSVQLKFIVKQNLTDIFKTGLTKLRTLLGENIMAYLKMNLI